MQPPSFPKKFCDLVRGLLQFDPSKRTPLCEAYRILVDVIEQPSPAELLSFYTHIVNPTHAGALTCKAICQVQLYEDLDVATQEKLFDLLARYPHCPVLKFNVLCTKRQCCSDPPLPQLNTAPHPEATTATRAAAVFRATATHSHNHSHCHRFMCNLLPNKPQPQTQSKPHTHTSPATR
ncbi:hypothetical protein Pelo_16477 [Pelomyxa schiedti]|nr:hypothetical protein Pelo_16477 [Pelomyxa schiedti]